MKMAKDEVKRQAPSILQADVNALSALKNIENYSPINPACRLDNVISQHTDMINKQELETQAEKAWKTARDEANDAEWAYHNIILEVKEQVIAQFGKDSNQLQSLGLKKKSEYKRPTKKDK